MKSRCKQARIVLAILLVASWAQLYAQQNSAAPCRRELSVVLYPFIPEYKQVFYDLKNSFEKAHPDIQLNIVDLFSNYYSPGSPNDYIGNANANLYELDSVFLQEFAQKGKIQPMPSGALLPEDQLLGNAAAGSRVGATRYGAAHWVCGNFLFFKSNDKDLLNARKLSDLEGAIGSPKHPTRRGLMTDLKGKSTLGEFYLETAFDHYGDWTTVSSHLSQVDPGLLSDLVRLAKLCDSGFCRNQVYHDSKPGIYGRQFAKGNARTLIGYSELLHEVLLETNLACAPSEGCLTDADIDVTEFPSDDSGEHQISWVDSFVLDSGCKGQCATDAIAFVNFMNADDTFKQIVLHSSGAAPAYLLPAKASLYSDAEIIGAAHLYPKLKAIIENAVAPSAVGLNDSLRTLGKELDAKLP